MRAQLSLDLPGPEYDEGTAATETVSDPGGTPSWPPLTAGTGQLAFPVLLGTSELLDDGLVAEVERLGPLGRTAATAIGYREAAAHLRGELTAEEMRERIVVATRRFARRQDSWFRKDPRITWLRHDDPELADKAVSAVGSMLAG